MKYINLPAQPLLGKLVKEAMTVLQRNRYRATDKLIEASFGLGDKSTSKCINHNYSPKYASTRAGFDKLIKKALELA